MLVTEELDGDRRLTEAVEDVLVPPREQVHPVRAKDTWHAAIVPIRGLHANRHVPEDVRPLALGFDVGQGSVEPLEVREGLRHCLARHDEVVPVVEELGVQRDQPHPAHPHAGRRRRVVPEPAELGLRLCFEPAPAPGVRHLAIPGDGGRAHGAAREVVIAQHQEDGRRREALLHRALDHLYVVDDGARRGGVAREQDEVRRRRRGAHELRCGVDGLHAAAAAVHALEAAVPPLLFGPRAALQKVDVHIGELPESSGGRSGSSRRAGMRAALHHRQQQRHKEPVAPPPHPRPADFSFTAVGSSWRSVPDALVRCGAVGKSMDRRCAPG